MVLNPQNIAHFLFFYDELGVGIPDSLFTDESGEYNFELHLARVASNGMTIFVDLPLLTEVFGMTPQFAAMVLHFYRIDTEGWNYNFTSEFFPEVFGLPRWYGQYRNHLRRAEAGSFTIKDPDGLRTFLKTEL